MALRRARFRGKVNIKGRPKEQAKAEIMLMKHQEGYESRARKRKFFIFLDIGLLLFILFIKGNILMDFLFYLLEF